MLLAGASDGALGEGAIGAHPSTRATRLPSNRCLLFKENAILHIPLRAIQKEGTRARKSSRRRLLLGSAAVLAAGSVPVPSQAFAASRPRVDRVVGIIGSVQRGSLTLITEVMGAVRVDTTSAAFFRDGAADATAFAAGERAVAEGVWSDVIFRASTVATVYEVVDGVVQSIDGKVIRTTGGSIRTTGSTRYQRFGNAAISLNRDAVRPGRRLHAMHRAEGIPPKALFVFVDDLR